MKLKDLTDQWLIKEHFFGMYQTDTVTGEVYIADPTNPSNRLPSSVITNAIDAAVSRLEGTIFARIRSEEHRIEYHDYDTDLFHQYSFISLDRYPVAAVHSMSFVMGEHGGTVWEVPDELIQIHGHNFGHVQILPISGMGSSYDPALMPFITSMFYADHMPSRIKVEYDCGMDALSRDLDPLIVRAIGLIAAVQPLNILGDILIGAGIASISTSFDGISQSVNTTASAENSAMSARIKAFERELYGDPRTPGLVQALQAQWRRLPLGVL
jgi:hypothetical protein